MSESYRRHRINAAAVAIAVLTVTSASAQQATVPATPGGSPAGADSAPALATRAFKTPVGLIFNTVRPDRVVDFEKVLGLLQDALSRSTDPTVQAQAKGWRFYKASEPGPSGTVLYVFVLDPAVPDAEYGLSRILADAFPDQAELREIWKLYTGAVTTGGSLLSLSPLDAAAAPTTGVPLVPVPAGPETVPRMLPPDREPPKDPAARR